jgi:hypothetical protein
LVNFEEMSRVFNSGWWSVELPNGRNCRHDHFATFLDTPSVGALQISAARKERGAITDEDLIDFAKERISGVKIEKSNTFPCNGFFVRMSTARGFGKNGGLKRNS